MSKSRTGQVVIISDDEDVHIPYVQRHLDTPIQLLDPQALLEGTKLSYELYRGKMTAIYDGVRLDKVAGVWYRKPRNIRLDQIPVDADFKGYSLSALHEHTALMLTAFEEALWISDYYAMWRAHSKTLQLDLAKRLGFRVPATLVTSDAAAARKFIGMHDRTIVKPLSNALPVVQGVQKTFFATVISEAAMPDLRNLHLAPSIFQQAIHTAYDVRVNVVGDKVFAAAIRTQNPDKSSPVRDWRMNQFNNNMNIEPCQLPPDVAEMCVAHVKKLGLTFGALDFVMDTKNQLWFIENNPNGQWAFVEKLTGQPIGKAVAQLLTTRI